MIHCRNCNKIILPETALEHSSDSWVLLQAIWYECIYCGTGNHIRFEKNKIQRISILGAPGPTWEVIEEIDEDISLRNDPTYLHVWHKQKHYEFKAM